MGTGPDWNANPLAAFSKRKFEQEGVMPLGDKSSYTNKQKRQARHIEEGYEDRGVSEKEAERRAWATVNAETHGGKKSGSGRGRKVNKAPSRKGGRKGGRASAARPAAARSRSAKKAAATRKRRKSH
jgi:plasmid stabilization system protein ParE